ncbi:MAG: hypothetical protein ACREGH_02760 [Minisyncoccia bacterium]
MHHPSMEFTLATQKHVQGTGRIGILDTGWARLIETFGIPHNMLPVPKESEWKLRSGNKVRCEWAFRSIDHAAVITIYDYKDRRPFKETTDWHVGGKGDRETIKRFFERYGFKESFAWDKDARPALLA